MRPTSRWAIASLICGILFFIPITALLAVIFGIIGIVQTRNRRTKGFGMALTGLILGALVVPMMILAAILMPSLIRAHEVANRVKCASNMRQIGLAITLYANDYQGQYPPDLGTLLKSESIKSDAFICPDSNDTAASAPADVDSGGHDSYIYLGKGLTTATANPTTPILYEVDAHHVDGANFLFGDGQVQFIPKSQEAAILNHAQNSNGQ